MATYDNESPYANTQVVNGQYLDILPNYFSSFLDAN